jgi:hypothetical protein
MIFNKFCLSLLKIQSPPSKNTGSTLFIFKDLQDNLILMRLKRFIGKIKIRLMELDLRLRLTQWRKRDFWTYSEVSEEDERWI